LLTPRKASKGLPPVLEHFDQAADELTNRAIAALRQPIKSLYGWLNQKITIQNAYKVLLQKKLIVHSFGRLVAASIVLHCF